MSKEIFTKNRVRKYFGKIREVAEMPNLIEVQKSSYELFLKSGEGDEPLRGEGIRGAFESIFPIKDFNETAELEFVSYELEKPKYDLEECHQLIEDVVRACQADQIARKLVCSGAGELRTEEKESRLHPRVRPLQLKLSIAPR